MPEDQRRRAEQSRRRTYVDLSRWWDHAETVPHLPTVVEAVFAGRRLRITYRRGGDQTEVRRTLDPFGLVVQGGTWYLVARARKREVRTYRVSRILGAEQLDEHHSVPDDFDLPTFWTTRKEDFHQTREGFRCVLRVRERALRVLGSGHHAESLEVLDDDTTSGWTTVAFTFETRSAAIDRVLGLGTRAVVAEPEDMRETISSLIREMNELYTA